MKRWLDSHTWWEVGKHDGCLFSLILFPDRPQAQNRKKTSSIGVISRIFFLFGENMSLVSLLLQGDLFDMFASMKS